MAGVSQIDYLVLTHYHADHAGGVVDLAGLIPIKNFVDHGPSAEEERSVPQNYAAYLTVRGEGPTHPGQARRQTSDSGIDVQMISAARSDDYQTIARRRAAESTCARISWRKTRSTDPLIGGENKQSVGMVISLGKFRLGDFGDLTWNKEHDLACPNNLIGALDVYVVSHHGQDISSLPALVHAEHPRVAIMDNGANKGGAVATFETLKNSPGLEDLWQLHYAVDAKDHNMPEKFIANREPAGRPATGVPDEGAANYIQLTARPDGSFTVKNSRNGFQKEYPAKR